MERLNNLLNKSHAVNNVINVNKEEEKSNNVNNVIADKQKYKYDSEKFKPRTKETTAVLDIAKQLNDEDNLAFHYFVVNAIKVENAYGLLRELKNDENVKKNTPYPIRSRKKYYAWLFMHKYSGKLNS